MPPDSIFDGPITNLLSILSILIEILFMYSREGVKKGFNVFKFGTFIGRFPSDGTAGVAVKGLIQIISRLIHRFKWRFDCRFQYWSLSHTGDSGSYVVDNTTGILSTKQSF